VKVVVPKKDEKKETLIVKEKLPAVTVGSL
jgi:hypothetical protein